MTAIGRLSVDQAGEPAHRIPQGMANSPDAPQTARYSSPVQRRRVAPYWAYVTMD